MAVYAKLVTACVGARVVYNEVPMRQHSADLDIARHRVRKWVGMLDEA